jgi:Tol biopolymer transport system component
LLDIARGTTTRFTFDAATEDYPLWSPDGSQIVFTRARDFYVKSSGGAGNDELLLKSDNGKTAFGWSADGRFITYVENVSAGAQDLYVLPMTGDRKPVPYLQTEFAEYENTLSPDSRWMAYSSNESGQQEVYVQPFPSSGGKWQISTGGGVQPQWRRDGKELFYLGLDGSIMAVDVMAAAAFEAGIPHALFKAQTQIFTARNSYIPAADGKRFLVNSFLDGSSSPISVILNWTRDLPSSP